MTRTYIVDFYPNIPCKGDVPAESIEVEAEGLWSAHNKGTKEALRRAITHPYVETRRKDNKPS